MSARSTQALRTVLLRSVSRSFYLSIRFLPAQLREPIALAYLLARVTDSVADISGISVPVRVETLQIQHLTVSDFLEHDANVLAIGLLHLIEPTKTVRQ